ncbi:uncharacterized protein [Nicotiana sylvestris]|uniref:uncharacterized protein n=1 Tax=Nicotiana sylvestris TaxID=4096 RepID=UPI00388C96D2
MYNRNYPNRRGLREDFVEGVEDFVRQAMSLPPYIKEGVIRCPCVKCDCMKFGKPEEVKVHLYMVGFIANYFVWTNHGEMDGSHGIFHNMVVGESSRSRENRNSDSRIHDMVANAFGMHFGGEPNENVEQTPNDEARHFYEQLEEASRPLREGRPHSELSVAVRLLSIKSDWNISQAAMDSFIDLMRELVDEEIELPGDFYKAKRLVSKLGLSSMRIDCCEDGCMLYYKDDANLSSYDDADVATASDEEVHYDQYGRIIIVPESDGFLPSNITTRIITKATRKLYDAPYASWREFPFSLKEAIFNEFKSKCVWEHQYSADVAANFNLKARKRLLHSFSIARQLNQKPGWLLQEFWDDLQRQWLTAEFLQKSEKGKKARVSEKGGSLHTGGAVSQGTIKRRMVWNGRNRDFLAGQLDGESLSAMRENVTKLTSELEASKEREKLKDAQYIGVVA